MENDNQRDQTQSDVTDTEFSQEVASTSNETVMQREDQQEKPARGSGWGIAGIVLAILSFFLWPYLLAPIGIVLGVVSVNQKSNMGWWAIAIGVIALILVTVFMIFSLPFRILF